LVDFLEQRRHHAENRVRVLESPIFVHPQLPFEVDQKSCEPPPGDYAARKRYEKDSFRTFDARADLWENLPDNREPVARGMLLAASVFTVAPRAAGFVRSVASVLSDSALKRVRQWRQDPWTYAAF
jgi:hypothetical protein